MVSLYTHLCVHGLFILGRWRVLLETTIIAIITFATTNIDDIFVLMILFAKTGNKFKKYHIVIGQYVAISMLIAISILGALGLNFVPQGYVGLLGIIPMALGIKEWLSHKKSKRSAFDEEDLKVSTADKNENSEPLPNSGKKKGLFRIIANIKSAMMRFTESEVLGVVLITLANGADNIGIYIPLFTKCSQWELILTCLIFVMMIGLWCFLGYIITSFPVIKDKIQRYKHIVVPVVFVALGIYILIESGLFGQA